MDESPAAGGKRRGTANTGEEGQIELAREIRGMALLVGCGTLIGTFGTLARVALLVISLPIHWAIPFYKFRIISLTKS
jgi:hypothetical protein